MKRFIFSVSLILVMISTSSCIRSIKEETTTIPSEATTVSEVTTMMAETTEQPTTDFETSTPIETEEPKENMFDISKADIELIALVTMAEAEGECDEGKRLVIDTILNRVDSPYFPNTVSEVVYQPTHFSSMWNGRIDRCYVRDDIYQLVLEELNSRSNYDVIFFTANHYGEYGVPMFQVGNHYFASYYGG